MMNWVNLECNSTQIGENDVTKKTVQIVSTENPNTFFKNTV